MSRHDAFFDVIRTKLNHSKAAIRLNLLRIVGSVCDAAEEPAYLLERIGLYDVIAELQHSDPAILVRSMAQDLIRSCEESDNTSIHSGHGGSRDPDRARRRTTAVRRTSASTTPPHLLERQMSMPASPNLSRAERPSMGSFFDVPERGPPMQVQQTPRRQRNGVTYINGTGHGLRPVSRDGSAAIVTNMNHNLVVGMSIARTGSPAFSAQPLLNRTNTTGHITSHTDLNGSATDLSTNLGIQKSRLPRQSTIPETSSSHSPAPDRNPRLSRQSTRDNIHSSSPSIASATARPRQSLYNNRQQPEVTVASSARRTIARKARDTAASGEARWS